MVAQNLQHPIMGGTGNLLLVAPTMPTGGGGGSYVLALRDKKGVGRSNSDTMSTSTCTTLEPVVIGSVQRRSSIHNKNPSLPRKCVRFAPQLETVLAYVLHRKDMTEDDIADRFLMQKDVMAIRAHAKLTTKYYRLKDPQMMAKLDACFDETTALVAKAAHGGDHRSVLRSKKDADTVSDQTALVRRCVDLIERSAVDEWCGRLKFHGRGLERYCSEHQRTVRAQTIAQSRKRTVQAQGNGEDFDYSANAEALAQVYRKWTRTASVFALVMAQADYRAAHDEEDDSGRRVAPISEVNTTDIDNVEDDRLNETGRLLQPIQAVVTRRTTTPTTTATTNASSSLMCTISPTKLLLPRGRKPCLLRRFKSTGGI